MAMHLRLFFLLLLVTISASVSGRSAGGRSHFASPGLHIGYTFGAGVTYGANLDLGARQNRSELSYGIALSYSYVHTKKSVHRLRTFSFMGGTDYARVKAGWGRVRNRWGYGAQNKCFTHGLMLEAGVAYPGSYSPWINIRSFQYSQASWAWFTKPYNTIHLSYNYNAIQSSSIQQRFR